MSDVEASGTSDPEDQEVPEEPVESGSDLDDGLDEEDLRSIEDELFDLEDELIEMQGTTIRTFDESDEQQDLQQVYTFRKPDDASGTGSSDGDEEDGDFLARLEAFKTSMETMQEVKPGQLLAADLRGDTPEFDGGMYTITTPKANRIFAGRVGQVCWSDDTVHVLPVHRVEEDLTPDDRDVRFDGSVFVEGSVRDNMVIEATGNIWVMESVGRSNLKAGGDIVVGQGIKGSDEHFVDANGNVYAEFIENARISAGGSIFTEEVIMHSEVDAGESICLVGEKGYLVGGQAQATSSIYAKDIGSKNYPETIIQLGASGALQRELEQAQKKKNELEEQESEYAKDVQNLLNTKEDEDGLPPEDEERLRKFQFELNHVRQDLQETKSRIEDLRDELDTDRQREVIVDGTVFPGAVLKVGEVHEELEEEKSHTAVVADEGELKFNSYHDPDLDIDLTTDLDPEDSDLEEKFELPSLDQLRKHIVYREEDPLFDRERQFQRLLDLPGGHELVLIDVTEENEEETGSDDSENGGEDETKVHKNWWGIEVREGESKKEVRRHYDSKRKDSVKVKCESPEEGVRRAAKYFGVESSELAVKILEEGSSGVLGFGQKDYLIRAVLKSRLNKDDEESGLEENDLLSEASAQEEVAGFINLENTEEGLKLAVYPPEGHGMPVTVEQVEDELEEEGFTNEIDWGRVEEMVEEAEGEKEIIGPRQRDPEIDGSFSVNVNESETEAYLTVYPPKPEGIPVEQQEVIEHLEEDGMDYDRSAVEELFENERYEEDVLVASGSEPVPGEDGTVEFNVDLPEPDVCELLGEEFEEDDGESDADEDPEAVDHRQGEEVISVRKNEILAEITPATEGEPGITVYGEDIPCEAGEPIQVDAGNNVRMSGDRTQLIAEEDGRVVVKKGKLVVEPVFVVEGDLDYETGNVDFDGVVVVKGQIMDGFKVEATERVEAQSAGKCKIFSDGDVYLKKGMAGKEEGLIRAQGDVYVKYLENTQVQAGGDVHVQQTIMHSTVDAGENLVLERGKKGAIIGGKVRAGRVISVKKLGSGMAPNTELEVGIRPKTRDRVAELENEIESQKSKFEKVRLGLQGLNDKIEEVGGKEELPEDKQEKHTRLSNVAGAIKHKIESLHSELEDLRNEIQSSEGGAVYVEGDVFPGTKITIQTATLHITDNDNFIRCVLENGEVLRLEYEDPDLELEPPETIL